MKQVLALIVALGVAALFSSVALAEADCAYHKTQAAVDKASKDVAVAPATEKADAGQIQTAQASQPAKADPQPKK